MKLPENQIVEDVAGYYDISTKGRFTKWLKLMNANSAVYYYKNGELKHTRVRTLLTLINQNR